MTCLIFGSNERHLRLMEEELDVVIHAQNGDCPGFGRRDCLWRGSFRQVTQAVVLVEPWMTVGTPDVVTAIGMVKKR